MGDDDDGARASLLPRDEEGARAIRDRWAISGFFTFRSSFYGRDLFNLDLGEVLLGNTPTAVKTRKGIAKTPLSFMDEFELINGVPAFVLESCGQNSSQRYFTCHAFSASGAFLAAGDNGGMIRVWDTDNFKRIHEHRHVNGQRVGCVGFLMGSETDLVACDIFGCCEHFSVGGGSTMRWTLPSIEEIQCRFFVEDAGLAIETAMDPNARSAKIWAPCVSGDGTVIAQPISTRISHQSFVRDTQIYLSTIQDGTVQSIHLVSRARSLVSRISLSDNGSSLMAVYAPPLYYETAVGGDRLENCVEIWPRIVFDGTEPKSFEVPCRMGKWANGGEYAIGWTSGTGEQKESHISVWETASLVKAVEANGPCPAPIAHHKMESDDSLFQIDMVSPSKGGPSDSIILAIGFAESNESEIVVNLWDAQKNAVLLQFETRTLFKDTLVGRRQYISAPEVMEFYWGHNDHIMEKSTVKITISPCKKWIAFYSSESNRGYLWSLKDAIPLAKLDLPAALSAANSGDPNPAIVSTLKTISFTPSGNKVVLMGKNRMIAFVPAFLQMHRGLQMEHIHTSDSKYVTYDAMKLSHDGSTMILSGHSKPTNVSTLSERFGLGLLRVTERQLAGNPQLESYRDTSALRMSPKDYTLSRDGSMVAYIFLDNSVAVANVQSAVYDPEIQLHFFTNEADYTTISTTTEDTFNRVFFAAMPDGSEQLVCFSLLTKGCICWFDIHRSAAIDRIPFSVDQSLGVKLTKEGSHAIVLGTQTAQIVNLQNRAIVQAINFNLNIPRGRQMLAAESEGASLLFSDTDQYEVSEDGSMVLLGWDIKHENPLYLNPGTRSKRLKRYVERLTEGINTHVWLSNDARWVVVAAEQGTDGDQQKGLRIYDTHGKRACRVIPDDLDTTGCEPLFDISGNGRIIVSRSVFARKKDDTTLFDVLMVLTPYAIDGSIPDFERLRLTEKTETEDIKKLISEFSWPLLNYPDFEDKSLFQHALTNNMREWVAAFYELGEKERIPIDLYWMEESPNEKGVMVEKNALQWAIDTRLPELVWDQLTRLVNHATTVDATAAIMRSSLPELYTTFPAIFMKLMESNMLIASYGDAPVAAKIFESEKFLVGTDSNDIAWDSKPAAKVNKLWASMGIRCEAATVHGKRKAEIPGEAKFVLVKDIAQVGMRGITRYLLMLNAPAEVFKTEIMQWTIALKWKSHGLRMCLQDFVSYVVFLAIFIIYAYLLGRPDHYKDDTVTGYLIMIPLLIAVGMGLWNLKGEWAQFRRYESDSLAAFKEKATGRLYYLRSQWNWVEMVSYLFMFPLPAIHILSMYFDAFDYILSAIVAVESLLLSFKILYFAQAFRISGPLVIAVREVVLDIRVFFVLMFMILIGFGVAFNVLFRHSEEHSDSFGYLRDTFLTMFVALLGDFDLDAYRNAKSVSLITTIFFVLYMLAMMIMLLNLLIGIMGDSFDKVRNQEEAEFLKGRASVIDDSEAGLSQEEIDELENQIGTYLHALCPSEVPQELESWAGKIKAFEKVIEKKLDTNISHMASELKGLKDSVEELKRAIHAAAQQG